MMEIYLVIQDFPNIFMEVEKAFLKEENAHRYILETFPYFVYYPDHDMYAMADLKTEEEFENEERYYILTKVVYDA
jgi:hypothetical protein